MPNLPVKALPSNDNGRLLVRINFKHRAGIRRYGVAELTNSENSKSVVALMLGHDDETAIFMPYDIRVELGVGTGDQLNFTVKRVGWIGKICWYLRNPDPAVHIPAWLAVASVFLGLIGVAFSVLGVWLSQGC